MYQQPITHQPTLQDLMTRVVLTAAPGEAALAVIRKMREACVSSVVVTDPSARPLGIFTESDAVLAAHRHLALADLPVCELMSAPPLTAGEDTGFRDGYRQMVQRGARHLIVADSAGRLLGVVGEGDFLSHLGPEQLLSIKEVASVMSRNVVRVAPEDSLATAVRRMSEGRFGCVVVAREQRPLGILTERDVIGLLEDGADLDALSVDSRMSCPIVTITAGEAVVEAERRMHERRIRRLVVVDARDRMVGLITRHDLVKGVPGVYVEMLRDAIERQSHLLQVTRKKLDARLLLDNILNCAVGMAVIATDLDYAIAYANPKVKLLFGLDPNDILGEDLRPLLERLAIRPERLAWARQRIEQGNECNFPLSLERDGVERHFELWFSGLCTSDGDLRGCVFQARDISARVRAERAALQGAATLRAFMSSAQGFAVYRIRLLDNSPMLEYASPSIQQVMGVRPAQALSDWFERLHPDDRERVSAANRRAMETGEAFQEQMRVYHPGKAQWRWIQAIAHLETTQEGPLRYFNGLMIDITEQKHAESQARRRIAMEQTMAEVARRFNETSLDTRDEAIEHALQAIGQVARVDRSYLFELSPCGEYASNTHEWCAAGIAPEKHELQQLPLGEYPHFFAPLRETGVIVVPRVEGLPEESAGLRGLLEAHSIQSLLAVAIRWGGAVRGFVGFDAVRQSRDWDREEIKLLQVIGSIFASVLKRLEAERELKYKKRQLDKAMDMARLGSWELDIETRKARWSGQTRGIFGVSPQAPAEPNTMLGALHPDDRERVAWTLDQACKGLMPYETECRVIAADGSLRYLHSRGERVLDAAGRPATLTGFVQDITELRAAEALRRESMEQYKRLVESAPVIVYRYSRRCGGLYYSAAVQGILGYSPDDLRAHPTLWHDSIHKDDIERVNAAIAGFTEGAHFDLEYRIRDAAGDWHWFHDRDISLSGQADEPVIEGLVVDITERMRGEQEREELQGLLRQTQKKEALGQLTAGIAHDFNNILASAAGYTELALERFGDESSGRLHRYLTQILRAALRAESLVDQLLLFGRDGSGESRPMRLQPLIQEVVRMLRPTFPASLDIQLALDARAPAVSTDPAGFHQVLMNLCLNARDALAGRGRLSIDLAMRQGLDEVSTYAGESIVGDWVELTVSDTGSGIDQDIIERIFDPFFSTKGPGKGSGMGLSVVYGIVRDHAGHVLVESEPGKGSRFRIFLPPAECEERSSADDDAAPAGTPRVPPASRILVLDDDAASAFMLSDMLRGWGHRTLIHTSAGDALRAVQEGPDDFDLLITGQSMPEHTGRELLSRVRRLRPDLPCLVMIGYSAQVERHDAEALGFDGFLGKPIRAAALKAEVTRVLLSGRAKRKG